MRTVYDWLLRLYPDGHRRQFGEEMALVFEQARVETASQGSGLLTSFYFREIAGVLRGACEERLREFSNRRSAMRTQFRFPKTTPILMTVILAGVVLAIRKGEAIQASLPDVNPAIGPIHPAQHGLLPEIGIWLLSFYVAGLIGWAILFALRRSGSHRLDAMASGQR
jgi:hypothetical protein